MAKKADPAVERQVILQQPAKRPYGARLRIHVQSEAALGGSEDVCVPLPSGAFMTIEQMSKAPWEGGRKYKATLEGFPTAAAAEAAGRRLVQAFLWTAVSTDVPLRLEYSTYEAAAVFERQRSSGMSFQAYATSSFAALFVLGELHDAYAGLPEPDQKLLLSMEIFCAARLESSQRATFLLLVSALEPLAQEMQLGSAVTSFIQECADRLVNSSEIPAELKNSVRGRLFQLRSESIRQALRRVVQAELPENAEAADLVDHAYALRSQLVHTGLPADLDTDLEQESRNVARLIRTLYAKRLGRDLKGG